MAFTFEIQNPSDSRIKFFESEVFLLHKTNILCLITYKGDVDTYIAHDVDHRESDMRTLSFLIPIFRQGLSAHIVLLNFVSMFALSVRSGGKDNIMPKKKETKYKVLCNTENEYFISADGKTLCYRFVDCTGKSVIVEYEIGMDGITEEFTFMLDDMYYREKQVERKEEELKDQVFEIKRSQYESNPDGAIDPMETLSRPQDSPEYEEDKVENPDVAKVRQVVDTAFTEEQQDLYYRHFGMREQLEHIRQEEVLTTGKSKTHQAMLNRKNRLIKKVAKQAFGVDLKKHRKDTKKD